MKSSVADDCIWFDTWPKVLHLPYDQRPLKLAFGDDSEMTRDEKQQFVSVYDNFGTQVTWNVGDLAIVCSYRLAHGRPEINLNDGEELEPGVLISEPLVRQETLDDKW